jgi:uncharacterized protein DUF6438
VRNRILVALVVVSACGSSQPPAPPVVANQPAPRHAPHDLIATFERQECYGWCPIYKVSIYRDGAVEYHGESFVKIKGDAKTELTDAQLGDLERAFEEAHYMSFAATYTHEDATDSPTSITSYRDKRVVHYHGDFHAPKALGELEVEIDRIVGIERWIGTPAERDAHAEEWR